MPRNKGDIQDDIARLNNGSVDANECIFCEKSPNITLKDIPLCRKCNSKFHLLIELQAI